MRILSLAIALLTIFAASTAWAQTAPFHAGVTRISVSDEDRFDTFVWYPTDAVEIPWQAGPFPISASRNAPIAAGQFPVLLLSHGGGPGGGSPLILRNLSTYLAREGFIVVTPIHGKTPLLQRPHQIAAAFDATMADPRFATHADADKLAMLGFSLGGAVALENAGGITDFEHLAAYCAAHPNDETSCGAGPGDKTGATPSKQAQPSDELPQTPRLPLKALVLLDPFAVLFTPTGLAAVKIPTLVFRPKQSDLGEKNLNALIAGLPYPPKVDYMPGGHFTLTDVCPPALELAVSEVCKDAQSVDRAAIQIEIERQIAAFFHSNLQ